MWANGIQSSTFEYLKGCYDNTTKVSDSIHETLSKLFYSYLVVGGMPENVQIYVDTHDIAKVVMNQRSIWIYIDWILQNTHQRMRKQRSKQYMIAFHPS